MKRINILIVKMLFMSVVTTVKAETFVPDFGKLCNVSWGWGSSPSWDGKILPDGGGDLAHGGQFYQQAISPEGMFSFKGIYDFVASHLKQKEDILNIEEALYINFYFGSPDGLGTVFYIDDKEFIRKLMHWYCDKIVSSPDTVIWSKRYFMDALSKHPLVPGDEPYLKAVEIINNRLEAEGKEINRLEVTGDVKPEAKEEVTGDDKSEVKSLKSEEEALSPVVENGVPAPPPAAAKEADGPNLLFYVGVGVLLCAGAALYFTRKK